MYSKNLTNFLALLVRDGKFHLNLDDEVVRDTLMATRGEVVNPRIRELLGLLPLPTPHASNPPIEHLARK
jgi:NAD(P) transhydrogenase subunit alpha